jgi:hypothetical protein
MRTIGWTLQFHEETKEILKRDADMEEKEILLVLVHAIEP